MKDMTIKKKLVGAFSIIAILVAILAGYSSFGVSGTAEGFTNYRVMAKNSVLSSGVQANMLMLRMSVKDYLKNHKQNEIDKFNSYYEKTSSFVDESLQQIADQKRKDSMNVVSQELRDYRTNFLEVVKYMNQRDEIVLNNLNVNGKKIEQLLSSVMHSAHYDKDLDASMATAEAVRTLLLARLYTVKYLVSNSVADADRVHKEFDDLERELVIIQQEVQNPTRLEQLQEAVERITKYKNGVDSIIEIIQNRNTIIDGKLNKIGPSIAKHAEDIKLSIKKDQDSIGEEVAEVNGTLLIVTISIALIVFILVITMAFIIPRSISTQIEVFQKGLLSFFGFLNKEIKEVSPINIDSDDEIGVMSKVVNQNIEKTKLLIEQDEKLINDVKEVVANVNKGNLKQSITSSTQNKGLEELKNLINEMFEILSKNVTDDINKIQESLTLYQKLDFRHRIKNPVGDVSIGLNLLADIINEMLVENKANGLTLDNSSAILLKNVDKLNQNSNQAAAALEETAAAVEEVTSNISSTTTNVVEMSKYAAEVTNSVQTGQSLATQTTNAMDDINEQVTSISEAIKVIDQISFQTNILSLNAAVEAATAGEAGKGFAVVAQEVRNLAARSAEAANEIKNIVENATKKANDGKKIADNMIEGYSSLNNSITKTIDLITDVEAASKEQQAGIVQINDTVNALDRQTQENANIASQTHDVAVQTDKIAKLVVSDTNKKEFIGKESVKMKNLSETPQIKNDTEITPRQVKPRTVEAPKTDQHVKRSENTIKPIKSAKTSNEDDEWTSF